MKQAGAGALGFKFIELNITFKPFGNKACFHSVPYINPCPAKHKANSVATFEPTVDNAVL